MPQGTVWVFFGLAFAITWTIAGLLIAFPQQIETAAGPIGYSNPLFIFAVYSPAIAAVGLIWRHHGIAGLRGFFARLALARMSMPWWVLLIVGIPAVSYAAATITGNFPRPFPFSPWYGVIPAMIVTLFIGPIEEFGWRGLALPLLQRRLAPFWAGLLLGVVWAAWHIPAFFISGAPQQSWSLPAFFVGVVALSVVMTGMFNASRGSLLIPALIHCQCNGPAWPKGPPWDSVLFVVMAAIVVSLNRRAMFSKDGAAIDVVAPSERTQLVAVTSR